METPLSPTAQISAAFAHAVRYGWMSGNQYRFVVRQLLRDSGCSLLVFGTGHDSQLWADCVGNRVAFVEDNPKYLTIAPATVRVFLCSYPTRVGVWSEVPEPSHLIAGPWDYVLVDGPAGFHPSCPGRQIPIAWARDLAKCAIFVHDYERPWERELCDRLLAPPASVLKPTDSRRGDLAVFHAKRFSV